MGKLSIFNKVIFFLNSLLALFTFIAIVIPFVPVTAIPSLAVLSLIFPLLVIANFIFLLYWLLVKKRHFLLSGTMILLWYFVLGPFYQFSGNPTGKEDNRTFSVMSFNARNFNELEQLDIENVDSLILDFVTKEDPDILCFQECHYSMKHNNALDQYENKFVDFIYREQSQKVVQAVYSKFPIVHIDSIVFPDSSNSAIFVDLIKNEDTIRVYNLHLQSFRIIPELDAITNEKSARLLAKSRRVMLKQFEQANLIRDDMERTDHKKIVVGDFNNTQYSNVFQTIKGDMNDTFDEQGIGFGRTYNLMGFPIRIDYILADTEFEVVSHQNFKVKLSDHYPVMATLRLPSEE